MKKDFLSIQDFTQDDIKAVFALAKELKKDRLKCVDALKGKSIALIFQKPSNRTRVSFEAGIFQLGGQAIYLKPEDINIGVRESIKDVAQTLSRYLDAIIMRTFGHHIILELAKHADIPVINGLSDLLHPCQALSDIFTIAEKFEHVYANLSNATLAYVGDGNNVCHSLLYGAAMTGLNLRIATPRQYSPKKEIVKEALELAKSTKAKIELFNNVREAVKGCDVIYTDVWTSMGQEEEAAQRKKAFYDYQINRELLAAAAPGNPFVMHCLPAHRGEEITNDVMDSDRSIIFEQAENRLHVQKAILLLLLGGKS